MMKHYTNPDIKTIALRTEGIIALSNNTRNSIDFTSTDIPPLAENNQEAAGPYKSCGFWIVRPARTYSYYKIRGGGGTC